jgi:hypothetical protein
VVQDFVAVRILTGELKLVVGDTKSYQIVTNSLASLAQGTLSVVSLDSGIATAEIVDDKLVVKGVDVGSVNIKVSVIATREHSSSPQTYTYTYTIVVQKASSTTNWWLIVGLGIAIVAACFVIYKIMVNKRLIKNKYPKY